jgi:AmiR/NasT family two-component response regulator
MQKAVRVLVANRPKLMRDLILATFADQPDIEVVGEVADDKEIAKRVNETLPDFLFIALDDPGRRPRICDTIFLQHPTVRIIAIAPGENCSVCYWASLDIHSNHMEASEGSILGAIRESRHLAGEPCH